VSALGALLLETLERIADNMKALLPSSLHGAAAETHGASRWVRWSEHRLLGRKAMPDRAFGDGIVIGFLGRRLLQTPAEDNMLVLGVQRSGKTSTVVVPTLLTWNGAAVATSTKQELVRFTSAARRRIGPVWVFSPLDRDHSWISTLGLAPATWNPISAAFDTGAASELADHFTAQGKTGISPHWYMAASNLITALAVVEGERQGDMATLLARLNRTAVKEFAPLAAATEDQTAADLLTGIAGTPVA
jgi:type IV secretory pathway TraG/TraD family ATPase VirD4